MSTNEAGKKNSLPIFQYRLNELRGEMSQAEFAKKLNIARATVGLYENGYRIPDAYVLKQIAERCDVSTDWLLGISNDMKGNADNVAVEKRLGLTSKSQEELKNAMKLKNEIREHNINITEWETISVINFLLEDGVPVEWEKKFDNKKYYQKMLDILASYLNYNPPYRYQIDYEGKIEKHEPHIVDGEETHNPYIIKLSKANVKNLLLDELKLSIRERESRLKEWENTENGKHTQN